MKKINKQKIFIGSLDGHLQIIKDSKNISELTKISNDIDALLERIKTKKSEAEAAAAAAAEAETTAKTKELNDAKALTTTKISTIEPKITETKSVIDTLPETDDKSSFNQKLQEVTTLLKTQKHSLTNVKLWIN